MKRRTIGGGSAEYPLLLKEIPDPPRQLEVAGRRMEQGPAVAVVGSRRASPYGIEIAEWMGAELAKAGVTIVSGLAFGIDAAAHRGALAAGGSTVAVMGCGVDVCYPAGNRRLYAQIASEGTLVSEYPDGTVPMPYHFPIRNRIIAGMTLGVLIVEAKVKGGAMITARLAADFGREVFAVPGMVHSSISQGPHSLIREGARLVTSPEDVLEDLGLQRTEEAGERVEDLGLDEQRVLDALRAEPILLDLVASRARMPASTVAAVLLGLEMRGLVTRMPGGRYARAVKASGVAELVRQSSRC
ncbi:MAG: DNA-processing protein DprA [Actinomycetota bacterium]|nr:DNA-processing protein DprA [Actinomycetota bacterium]